MESVAVFGNFTLTDCIKAIKA